MSDETIRKCPRCGGPVIYRGRGRRPVWCSTRCRNEAAVVRRGAREAGVEIRMIDVPRQPRRGQRDEAELKAHEEVDQPIAPLANAKPGASATWPTQLGNRRSTDDRRVLTAAVLADPAAVATVVHALCLRQKAGKFSGEKWAAIRSGVVSLADLIRAEEARETGSAPVE